MGSTSRHQRLLEARAIASAECKIIDIAGTPICLAPGHSEHRLILEYNENHDERGQFASGGGSGSGGGKKGSAGAGSSEIRNAQAALKSHGYKEIGGAREQAQGVRVFEKAAGKSGPNSSSVILFTKGPNAGTFSFSGGSKASSFSSAPSIGHMGKSIESLPGFLNKAHGKK